MGNAFSYAENIGSSMSSQAAAGIQDMASSGSSYSSPSRPSTGQSNPISEFRDDKNQALKSGMNRFGMSADALRNIAKTVGIRRLDSSNDLRKIQEHFDKQKPKDKGPENQGTSTIDVFGPRYGSPGMVHQDSFGGGRDYYSPGRNSGDYDGGRYGEFYADLPDNTRDNRGTRYGGGRGRVMSPEELGIAPGQRGGRYGGGGMRVQGGGADYWREQNKIIADNRDRGIGGKPERRPGKNKGRGGRGVSTDDVFGGRRRGAKNRARNRRNERGSF
tara:strand:- start:16314 stop:17135 length:822 start_codon:yes stop_codon:yes gene_type:complete